MIIYNTIDYPVVVTIDDAAYDMEPDSELELRIPSGTHTFRIYKVDYKGRPIQKWYGSYGYRRNSRRMTVICHAMLARVSVRRDTKLYLREKLEDLLGISTEQYKREVFDVIIDNGEIEERRDGYLDERVRNRILRSFKLELIFGTMMYLLLTIACCVFLYLLRGVAAEHGLSESDICEILPFVIAPVVSVFCIVWNLRQAKNAHIFKDIPVLPVENDHPF